MRYPPTPSKAPECTRATNIRAPRTRRAWPGNAASRISRAARNGYAFASGMAATSTLMDLLESGSHVLAMDDLYGGTFRLFERVRRRSAALDFTFADMTDPKAALAAIRPGTRMIWIESPTNPLLRLVDIAAIAEIGAQARHPDGRRQYLCDAMDPAAAGTRRRHRRALGDQVPEWPLGHGRRHRGRRGRGTRRAHRIPAERGGRGRRPVRQLSRAAGTQDAAAAHASVRAKARLPSRAGSSGMVASSGCYTRACRRIRSTRSPCAR